MINEPPPFKGLNIRIPIANQGSTLEPWFRIWAVGNRVLRLGLVDWIFRLKDLSSACGAKRDSESLDLRFWDLLSK